MHIMLKEIRARLPYEGKPRHEKNRRGGWVLRDARTFSAPPGSLHWTRRDQMTAVDLGFFFERVVGDEHVRVLPLQNGQWGSDLEVMCWLEAQAFRHDGFAMRALAFIEQQDKFGYTGVWEGAVRRRTRNAGIEFWSPTMKWYKDMKAEQRAADLMRREHCRRGALKRWGNAKQSNQVI